MGDLEELEEVKQEITKIREKILAGITLNEEDELEKDLTMLRRRRAKLLNRL